MRAVITLEPVRLNGEDVDAGRKVEIEDAVYRDWISAGIAADCVTSDEDESNAQSTKGILPYIEGTVSDENNIGTQKDVEIPPEKDGEKIEVKDDNPTSKRTTDTGRSKKRNED